MRLPWIFSCATALLVCACHRPDSRALIVYTSQDQQFAEPILKEFTRETGIEVRTVYDSEAVKTVGLANRLLAEARNPQCDLWWSNEALRTRQLAARGVLDSNSMVTFGFRSRRLVVNTNRLMIANAPKSLRDLTNAEWKGRVALAYPMFGTTSAQFIALRRYWGTSAWEAWCRALAANKPFLVDGNSVVVRLVGRGEATIGLTDSDDIIAAQREALPVAALPLTPESLLIPNSIAIVRGSRRPSQARRLLDYLHGEAVLQKLIAAGALEGGSAEHVPHLEADWVSLAGDLEAATEAMRVIFLR